MIGYRLKFDFIENLKVLKTRLDRIIKNNKTLCHRIRSSIIFWNLIWSISIGNYPQSRWSSIKPIIDSENCIWSVVVWNSVLSIIFLNLFLSICIENHPENRWNLIISITDAENSILSIIIWNSLWSIKSIIAQNTILSIKSVIAEYDNRLSFEIWFYQYLLGIIHKIADIR